MTEIARTKVKKRNLLRFAALPYWTWPPIKKETWLTAMFALSGCTLPSIYHAPAELTPQTGASIVGIVKPMPNLVSTGAHICVNSIDGARPRYPLGGNCTKPILMTPGKHTIEIGVDFHPFPAEFGIGTINASFDAGQAYFIRATGGPVAFINTDGQLSIPQDLLVTVWIDSAADIPITEKLPIPLQTPQPAPMILFVPSK